MATLTEIKNRSNTITDQYSHLNGDYNKLLLASNKHPNGISVPFNMNRADALKLEEICDNNNLPVYVWTGKFMVFYTAKTYDALYDYVKKENLKK